MEWLTELFNRSFVNLGIFLAIAAAIITWFILERTTFGYELKAVGYNKHAAKYAGIKVNRNIVYAMMISGALAGLAGATYYLGYTQNLKIGELPSLGFDGIAVSLLALNAPLGVLLSGALFGFMNAAKSFMTASTDVPNELVPIIMAIIIYFAATNLMIKKWIKALGKLLYREPKKESYKEPDKEPKIEPGKEPKIEQTKDIDKDGGDN
jgi:simple sugar transport system permease protein